MPYLIGRSIDDMLKGKSAVRFEILGIIVAVLLAAYLTDALIIFLQGWLMAGVSQHIVLDLRSTLFAKLQKLPLSFFDLNTHGELMSRLSNDIDNISSTISQSTTQLMSNVIAIAGSFTMMLVLNPLLTFASMITVPIVFILTGTIAKKTRVLFKEQLR